MKITKGSIRFFTSESWKDLSGVRIELGNDERALSVSRTFLPEAREYDSLEMATVLRDLANALERV